MKLRILFSLVIMSLLVATCKHDILSPVGNSGNGNGGDGSGNGGGGDSIIFNTCSPDTVYFANSILPMITSNCAKSGCHDAKTRQEGLVLDNYNGIIKIVQPGNAGGSKLYQVIRASGEDIMPPKPNQPLSSSDIASIKTWI